MAGWLVQGQESLKSIKIVTNSRARIFSYTSFDVTGLRQVTFYNMQCGIELPSTSWWTMLNARK